MHPFGWQVHIGQDYGALAMDARRLTIYRRVEHEVEVVVGFTDTGAPIVERHDPAVAASPVGVMVPYEALEAIAEAIKPGASQGEVARLEEALAVERRRVDAVLARSGMEPT